MALTATVERVSLTVSAPDATARTLTVAQVPAVAAIVVEVVFAVVGEPAASLSGSALAEFAEVWTVATAAAVLAELEVEFAAVLWASVLVELVESLRVEPFAEISAEIAA